MNPMTENGKKMVNMVKDCVLRSNETYNGNPNLKKNGVILEYTEDQILDIIKSKEDMIHFFENHVKIISLDKGIINFEPYEYQKEILKGFRDNRFTICLTGRQQGKCLTDSTTINIRNKKTGEISEVSIGDCYNRMKTSNQIGDG
jgi:hypothetical protein